MAMMVTLKLLTNVYGPLNEETGKQKCIKRNICYKKTFDSNQIMIQNYITAKGEISKSLSIVTSNGQDYVAKHSFKELEALTRPLTIEGFKIKK